MQQRYAFYLAAGLLALGASSLFSSSLSRSATSIPTPQEAAQQAEQLNPEQLTQIEIDEEIRDKLRSDPVWQEIAAAIRQDIMILKWGKGKPPNPAWKRYGAKAYPLLDYYSRSQDATRQEYAMVGIRSLGKPYTTLWLTRHIQRKLTTPSIDWVTTNLSDLRDGTYSADNSQTWLKDFGLDDPATRDRLVNLARRNLNPESEESLNYYQFNHSEFNKDFLVAVLGYDAVYPSQPSPEDEKPPLNLPEWSKFEPLKEPSSQQIQQAITYYRNLSPENQERILVERLGAMKAGEITPIGKAILSNLADDPKAADRVWAIAELDRHGDAKGNQLLQQIVNDDIEELHSLTRVTGYASHGARKTHAYYLLIGIAQKYPQSKFIQGCREYGDLTGKSYFDGAERSAEIRDRNAKKTAAQKVQDWQAWLQRYPNHPGADDATYWLGRSLLEQNDAMGAMQLWIKLMTQPVGDRDAVYLAYPYLRSLLDVGLSSQQIETLLEEPESKPLAPLLQYALSVRYARGQDYTRALQTSANLDLTTIPHSVLGSYYNYNAYWWTGREKSATVKVQQQMQAMLSEQRQRWQTLLKLQQNNTPEARYRLAANWAGAGGWKNGYMAIWDGFRAWHLPMEDCGIWWVCNLEQRDANEVRQLYQESSQNAVALSLFQKLLESPNLSPQLREKTLYEVAATLLWQWEDHPTSETLRIHPPAGVSGKPQNLFFDASYNTKGGDPEVAQKQMQQDYQEKIDRIVSQLQQEFPQSPYIDDLLFSSYYLSGKPEYLQQIVRQYPQSDLAAPAKFILDNRH